MVKTFFLYHLCFCSLRFEVINTLWDFILAINNVDVFVFFLFRLVIWPFAKISFFNMCSGVFCLKKKCLSYIEFFALEYNLLSLTCFYLFISVEHISRTSTFDCIKSSNKYIPWSHLLCFPSFYASTRRKSIDILLLFVTTYL